MKTIILPGYSERNREWAYEVKEEMGLEGVDVHEWRHWTKGSFSEEKELVAILDLIGKDNVNIIAKSVGTSVAMHLINKLPNKISKLILCGIPINGFSEDKLELFKTSLSDFPIEKVIVFQNEKDNLGSFDKVKSFIQSIDEKIVVRKMPRSDHHYPYPTEFREILR